MSPTQLPQLTEEKVEIPFGAFLVLPENPAGVKISAVVLIQEAFGVNHHMREMCRRVAAEGYIAIAPEFFHRSGKNLEFEYDFAKVLPVFSKLNNPDVRSDLEATFAYLQKRFGIATQNVAVMGYCFGGLAAMISATAPHPIATAIAYYGGGMVAARPGMSLSPVIQDFGRIQCPILLFFGDHDKSIPMSDIQAIEAELKKQGKKHEVVVYPGVGHAFSNDDRPSYDEAATKKAWDKTLEWLRR